MLESPMCSNCLELPSKGQSISKETFGVFNSSKKTNLKILIFVLGYWGKKFSFFFWKNWKNQKVLSKLIDL